MNDLVEIVRAEATEYWKEIVNPKFKSTSQEGIAAQLVRNVANEYVEYKNCGMVYRIIRRNQLSAYIPE